MPNIQVYCLSTNVHTFQYLGVKSIFSIVYVFEDWPAGFIISREYFIRNTVFWSNSTVSQGGVSPEGYFIRYMIVVKCLVIFCLF